MKAKQKINPWIFIGVAVAVLVVGSVFWLSYGDIIGEAIKKVGKNINKNINLKVEPCDLPKDTGKQVGDQVCDAKNSKWVTCTEGNGGLVLKDKICDAKTEVWKSCSEDQSSSIGSFACNANEKIKGYAVNFFLIHFLNPQAL